MNIHVESECIYCEEPVLLDQPHGHIVLDKYDGENKTGDKLVVLYHDVCRRNA